MTLVTRCVSETKKHSSLVDRTKRVVNDTMTKRVPHFSRTLREVGSDRDIESEWRHRSKTLD